MSNTQRKELRKAAERKIDWLMRNQEELPEEFSRIVTEHFHELIYKEKTKEEWVNENVALAYLLVNDVVFLNNTNLGTKKNPNWTTIVSVNCNDTFYYSTADAESVSCGDGEPDSELMQLYEHCTENVNLGYAKFCALKRKMRPLPEIVSMMKKAGTWDENLEKLKYPDYNKDEV
jgi:hypothetical protein